MKNDRRTKSDLLRDLNALRKQIKRLETDVRNKSSAEEHVRQALTWQNALVEGSRDAVVVTDIDSRIIAANSSVCKMTGYSVEELLSKRLHELYCEKDRDTFQKNYGRVIVGEALLHMARLQKKDGREVDTEFNSRRIDIGGLPCIHSTIRDITSRKQIERELTILDYAMRSISEAVTITDEHNTIIFVNDTFLRMYGYKRKELIGSPIHILRLDATMPPVDTILTKTLAGGWQGELVNRRKDGSMFPIWLSTSIVRDENGMTLGLIGVTTDITERKRAEEALQKSEERYRTLINNQEEGIAIVDANEYFTFVNPAGEKIFGVPPGTLVGRNLAEFADSGQMTIIMSETQKRMKGEQSSYELGIKRPNGEKRFLLVTGNSQIDNDGNFIGTFGVFQDITEHKLADQARQKAEAALRASEEYFREVIENSSDIIIIIDRTGTITYVSPSIQRFLGYVPNELLGKKAIRFIHPIDLRRAAKAFSSARLANDASVSNSFRILHKDGSDRILEGLGKNLLDNPSIAGFMMNVHDVTENRKAEAALRESRDQLRSLTARLESIREKERKHIAHEMHEDFGQILSAIKIRMSEFTRKYSHDEEFVAGITELSGFIDAAIRSVRKISMDLRPGVFDLLGLNAAIEWFAKEFTKQHAVPCAVTVPEEGVKLEEQSSIVLFRLLQDALNNVAEHAQATKAQIRLSLDAEYVELRVEDNGRGMSEEQLNNPSSIGFVRMKERALSVGGHTEIMAIEGKGTTVLIRIPLTK